MKRKLQVSCTRCFASTRSISTVHRASVVDHAARFTYEGHTGYGLYEHSFSGAMPRYGLE